MSLYLIPHSPEWFAALDEFDSSQAALTRQVLKQAGRLDVCSNCGSRDAVDYKVTPRDRTVHSASTLRLCEICRDLRASVLRETHVPFRFNPMSARERRIIHLVLKDQPGIRTSSEGMGDDRQLVIFPADKK